MLFPALDTLRLKANAVAGGGIGASVSSSSSSTHSNSHISHISHNGTGTRPSHFRTPPIDFIDSRASSPRLLDSTAASIQLGQAHQDGSQRTLKPQSSFSSLTKVDPFARIGTSLSATLKPGQRSDRPDSVASFGTDFVTGLLSIPPPPRQIQIANEPPQPPSRPHSVKKPSALNKRTTSLRQPSNTSLSSYEAPPDNLLPFPKPSATPKSVRSASGRRDIPPVPMVDGKYADYGSASYKSPAANGHGQRYESQRSTTPRLNTRTTSLGTTPTHHGSVNHKPMPPLPAINVDEDYAGEHHDTVPSLPNSAFDFGHNRSISNAGRFKGKSDKVLGLDPNTRLCSLFMISGVRKADPSKWIPADRESSTRIQPAEDSMNFFWRPEALNTTFPSDQTEKYEKIVAAGKKARPEHMRALARTPAYTGKTHNVPDAGPDSAEKMMNKALKYAHPKEVEIINSALQPNSTAHYFTFTLPCHTTQARNARDRLERGSNLSREQMRSIDMNADARSALNSAQQERKLSSQADITFHGATLTVWVPAEPTTVKQLKAFRAQLARKHQLDQVLQAPVLEEMPESEARGKGKRGNLPWLNNQYTPSMTDLETASEWEGESINIMSDDETRRKPSGRFIGGLGSNTGNSSMLGSAFDQPTDTEIDDTTPRPSMDGGDMTPVAVTGSKSSVFWIPFALTLVSRHPIYETMLDYIRLDWTKFSKDSRMHTYQICKILNAGTPRPGESIALRIGSQEDTDAVTIHARFPGGVDFDKGLIQTDFMLWPLFQAIDVDMVLTCVEVALSTQGRVIMTSSYPTMLCLCVNILKYMVELRGWHGICLPMIHSRDVSFIVEDPGPFIVGVPTETRWTVPPPPEVCILNLDENMLHLKRPPINVVTPRNRREKVKHKIYQALGNDFPIDRTVPKELKVAFLSKRFRTFNKVSHHKPEGSPPPQFLADKVPTPSWWKGGEVLAVFDKIMLEKHKKPSLIQRLTKSGLTRYDAQVTVGEQLAQAMMRRRALHYLESRDNLDDKTAKINQKLMQLMRDGDKYKKQFETFEKQADYLAQETIRLQSQMEKEQREASRLSAMNSQQGEMNKNLQSRLKATEDARAQAMRQLSDMQESMQDLEKEREEIMNIIESQINSAIEHLPYGPGEMGSPMLSSALSLSDDGASTASIGKARLARRASRTMRPTTAASGASAITSAADGMSLHSQDKAVSVLGAAKNGPGYKRMSSQTTGTIVGWGKGEVADRMAAIQHKLNLALSSVAEAQRDTEELRDDPLDQGDSAAVEPSFAEDGDRTSGNDALGIETDGSGTRQSFSSTRAELDNKAGDLAPLPPKAHHIPVTAGKAARQLAAVFIPPPPPLDDPAVSAPNSAVEPSRPPKSAERGLSAQDLGLVKPGQLRLKPKKENGTGRAGSPASLQLAPANSTLHGDADVDSAVIPPTPAEFGAIGRNTQSMLSVASSTGSATSASNSNGHGLSYNGGMTPSLTASTTDDMILSPPGTPGGGGDRTSIVGSEEGMMRRHSADVRSVSVSRDLADVKKASRLSTGTTAFGPI